jgi:hypothetical protein
MFVSINKKVGRKEYIIKNEKQKEEEKECDKKQKKRKK